MDAVLWFHHPHVDHDLHAEFRQHLERLHPQVRGRHRQGHRAGVFADPVEHLGHPEPGAAADGWVLRRLHDDHRRRVDLPRQAPLDRVLVSWSEFHLRASEFLVEYFGDKSAAQSQPLSLDGRQDSKDAKQKGILATFLAFVGHASSAKLEGLYICLYRFLYEKTETLNLI